MFEAALHVNTCIVGFLWCSANLLGDELTLSDKTGKYLK